MFNNSTTVSLLSIMFFWPDSDMENSGIPIIPTNWGWEAESRSAVAYSVQDTQTAVQEGKLTIQARFHKSSPGGRIQVRTRNINLDPLDMLSFQIARRNPGHEALGNVAPATVFFNKDSHSVYRGKHTFVPMKLENTRFQDLGVGIFDINWKWEFRELDEEATKEKGEDVWQEEWRGIRTSDMPVPPQLADRIELTKHRVYVLLDHPKAPFTSGSVPDFENGLPYRMPLDQTILDVACEWGRGAKSKAEAAKMVSEALFSCGRFTYNTNSAYLKKGKYNQIAKLLGSEDAAVLDVPVFFLSKVLERIEGGYGLGEKINCMDCALIVSSLANALGCHLRIGKFQNMADLDASDADHYEENRFEVNPILAIGKESVEATMAGLQAKDGGHFFSYHTVAWMPPTDAGGEAADFERSEATIFDACVQFPIDAETYESASGHSLETYIERLARDSDMGRPRCKPQPITVTEVQIH